MEFWPEPMKFLADKLNHAYWLRMWNFSSSLKRLHAKSHSQVYFVQRRMWFCVTSSSFSITSSVGGLETSSGLKTGLETDFLGLGLGSWTLMPMTQSWTQSWALMTWGLRKRASWYRNVAYIIKIKYFCEFVISVTFRKYNCEQKKKNKQTNKQIEEFNLDLDAEDSILVLNSVVQNLDL